MSAPGCFPDSIVGFQPDPAVADVTYVKYSIDTLKRSMRQISDGATQDNLSVEKLLSFKMRVPDLEEQRKISSVISAFDDLIENSRRRVEVLQETARALYQRLVEGQSGASLPSLPLSATVEVMSGGTPKKSEPKNWGGTIPFFTPRDAGKDWVALSSADRLSELGAKTKASPIFPEGTVFITARGTVGKLAIVGTPMAMNQSCYALRGKAGYPQSFVLLFMDAAVRQLRQNTGGATFDTIIRSTFDTVMVPTPSATEARAFAKECDPLIAAEIALCKMIAALEAQREYLLPKLISGELSVSSLDIDVTRIEARADLWRPTTVGG
jgi:type I restriction enzyme S subunit